MSDEIKIQVGTDAYEGWTDVSIRRSVDTIAGSFSFSIVDLWTDERMIVTPGQPCKIFIGDDKIITGYIDILRPSVSADSNTIAIEGRCKTGDLVDCSVTNIPGSWKNIDLLKLVKAMLSPNQNRFNLDVLSDVDLGEKISEFSADPGESIFEAISKVCQYRAIVPLSDVDGNLLLTNIGRNPAADDLIYGMNIVNADSEITYVDRFSEYIVKGQKSGRGQSWGKSMTEKFARSTDEYIERFRPKVITADSEISTEMAQKRANWEAQIRAGRSASVNVSLPGWRQSNGDLWRENMTVYVSIPKLRIDGEMLIREVEYRLTTSEKRLNLKLADPSIYAPEPKQIIKKTKKKTKTRGNW